MEINRSEEVICRESRICFLAKTRPRLEEPSWIFAFTISSKQFQKRYGLRWSFCGMLPGYYFAACYYFAFFYSKMPKARYCCPLLLLLLLQSPEGASLLLLLLFACCYSRRRAAFGEWAVSRHISALDDPVLIRFWSVDFEYLEEKAIHWTFSQALVVASELCCALNFHHRSEWCHVRPKHCWRSSRRNCEFWDEVVL